jgi:putative transposase
MTSDRTFIAAEVGHDNDAEEAATSPHHLAPPRRSVGRTRTAITSRKASGHARATGRALPPRDRRYPIRPPHRVPVESPAAGIWVGLHVPSAVPGLGPDGDLREAVDRGAAPVRRIAGHPVEMAIVGQRDGQSAFGGAATGPNPTDRGKRGTKRHTLTDQRGAPLAVVVTAANCHDMKVATQTLDGIIVSRPRPTPEEPQHLCLDKGYDSREIEAAVHARRYVPHMRHRGEVVPTYRRHPARRWVVERTGAWHNRFRKLLVRYEKYVKNYLGLVHLACCLIVYRLTVLG